MRKNTSRIHTESQIDPAFLPFAEKAVQSFCEQSDEVLTLKKFENNADFGKGGFGSVSVYQLFSPDNQLLFVIKAEEITQEESKNLPLLIPFCRLMQQLPLKEVRLLFPLAADCIYSNKKLLLLTASPAAEGIPLTQALSDYSEGLLSWEDLTCMIRAIAKGLYELNTLALDLATSLPLSCQKQDDLRVELFLLFLEEHSELFPFDVEYFKKKFAEIFHIATTLPNLVGYAHGDSNLTNFFYNPQNKLVTIIDSLTVFDSIDPQGKALGNIAQEIAFTQSSFYLYGTYYGLNQEKIASLEATFCTAYTLPIFPQQLKFYSLHYWMGYLIVVYKVMKKIPALENKLKKLQEYIINQISKILKGS